MRRSKMFEIILREGISLSFDLRIRRGRRWFTWLSVTVGWFEFRIDRTSRFGFMFVK